MSLNRRDLLISGSGVAALSASTVYFASAQAPSVIVLESEKHIGGHAITSGGNVPLGGGTSIQKKYGIEDSPDRRKES